MNTSPSERLGNYLNSSQTCSKCEEMKGFDIIDKWIYHDNNHVWPGFAGEPDGGNYGGSDF
jgi:hypothetical protein